MTTRPSIVVGLCALVGVLEGFDIQAIGVAAPHMAPALGLGPNDLGWIFFVSNLGLMVGAIGGGWVSDRIGRKPVFVAAIATFGLFTLATAVATGLPALAAVRFLAGLGLGAGLTNMVAIGSDVSDPRRQAFTTGLLFCGVPAGGALVATLSQFIPMATAWPALFVVGGIAPLILSVVVARAVPETRATTATGGAAVSTRIALFGEDRARSTVLLWLAIMPTLMALYLMLYWLPTLVAAKGLDPAIAPRAAIAFNLAGVAGALASGWLMDRVGARVTLTAAFALLIGVAAMLAWVDSEPALLALGGCAGALLLGTNYGLYGLMPRYYPVEMKATGTGAAMGAGRVGSIVGPLLPGFLLASGASAGATLFVLAPAALVAGGAVALLRPPRQTALG